MDINEPLHGYVHLWMIAIAVFAGFIVVIINKVWAEQHKADYKKTSIILTLVLTAYILIYCYICFFCRKPMEEAHIRLRPFWSFHEAFDGLSIRRLGLARSIALNILLYVPLGYLIPALLRGKKHCYQKTIWMILAFSISTEIIQYFTHTGLCELDDMINNLIGGLVGLAGYILLQKLVDKLNDTLKQSESI